MVVLWEEQVYYIFEFHIVFQEDYFCIQTKTNMLWGENCGKYVSYNKKVDVYTVNITLEISI